MKNPLKGAYGPTSFSFFRPVVGFVNGRSEAFVAAPTSHHVWSGPVEGQVVLPDFGHSSLQALQGTGLFQTQSRTKIFAWRVWKRKGERSALSILEQGAMVETHYSANISFQEALKRGC